MLFWVKVCGFFFVCGVLSMLVGTADQVFNLGIWDGAYPPVQHEANGRAVASTYGEFMLDTAIVSIVAAVLGSFLWYRLQRRYENALMAMEILETMQQRGYEEDHEEL